MSAFKQVTIVGLGLMGGSLGLALKRRRVAGCVVGLSRSRTTIREALRRRAIDCGTTDAREALAQADLVVLATPVDTLVAQARRLAAFMRRGSVLTDVGSVKGQIVSAIERLLPPGVAFVGSHPLCGSEQQGIRAARADLFDGSVCVVTPTAKTPPAARERVIRFWKPLVGRVRVMDPQTHDRLLAAVSHVPHVLAYGLMQATPPQALAIAPPSFLDATRVAQSDPELWDDILLGNRTAVLSALQRAAFQWDRARRLLLADDRAGLRRWLRQAQRRRRALREQA